MIITIFISGSTRLLPDKNKFVFTVSSHSSCIIFRIIDDATPEPPTNITLSLLQGNNPVRFRNKEVTINILDNDSKLLISS